MAQRTGVSVPRYQASPKGRASTSKDQAEGLWRTRAKAVAATAAGWMKNESGLPGMRSRVRGRSTTPSTMMRATWMPAGQSARAMDSARLRWAALAGAKAAVLTLPRREAVAPMKMMEPWAAFFIAGMTCWLVKSEPRALTRHEPSKSAGVMSSTEAKTPEPAL